MSEVKIAIVGGGLVGSSWASLFASRHRVSVYDVDAGQLDRCRINIDKTIDSLEKKNLLRGDATAAEQKLRVTMTTSLSDALDGAVYVQECVPESVEIKAEIFKRIAELVKDDDVVLASSSSTLRTSLFTADLERRSQCLIAHPVNPVHFLGLVEIVPADYTSESITKRCRELMADLGQKPVVLKKEVAGFALNRVQYAVINECWNLVQDGILDVNDVEPLLADGLGPRYCFFGPWEVAHLNGGAGGAKDYFGRYANGIKTVSDTFSPVPYCAADSKVGQEITKRMEERVPLEKLSEYHQLRDEYLMNIAQLKRRLDVNEFYKTHSSDTK